MEGEFRLFESPREAFDFLKSHYPIPNYLNGTEVEHIFVGNLVRRFLPEGGRILDIGCGGMNKSALIALLGYEVHGADDYQDPWHLRDDNLAKLRRFAENYRITLTIQRPGHYELDYPENYFDGCIISNVIEHLNESPRDLLNNAGLFAREGGYLFVTMPNSVNLRKRLSVLRGRSNYPSVQMFYHCIGSWRGHVREYTLPEQEYILRKNGFTICFSTTYHGMVDRTLKSQFGKYLYKTICRLFPTMRENLATVAQKPPSWKPVRADPDEFRKSMVGSVPKGVE